MEQKPRGRPGASADVVKVARRMLAAGAKVAEVRSATGLGQSTLYRLRREWLTEEAARLGASRDAVAWALKGAA